MLIVSRASGAFAALVKGLQKDGHPVEITGDILHAWELILTGKTQLVALDLARLGTPELQLLRQARAAAQTVAVPFLFLIPRDLPLVDLPAPEKEVARDAWLRVPFPPRQFMVMVERLWQQAAKLREAGRAAASVPNDVEEVEELPDVAPPVAAAPTDVEEVEELPDVAPPVDSAPPAQLAPVAAADPAAGASPPGGFAMSGHLSRVDPVKLVSLLEGLRITGLLHMSDGKRHGYVHFQDGSPFHAEMMGMEGPDALFLLFHMKDGEFRFEVSGPPVIRSIRGNTMALLLEGMRQMDSTKRLIKEHQDRKHLGDLRADGAHDSVSRPAATDESGRETSGFPGMMER